LLRPHSYNERFGPNGSLYTGKSEPSTRKDETSIKSDMNQNQKRVNTMSFNESKIYQKAEEIAVKRNIKVFKAPKNPKTDYFKIFFFNEFPEKKSHQGNERSSESTNSKNFQYPTTKKVSKADSQYLIIRIFPCSNKVQVEDSNIKKTLEARIGVDVDVCDQTNVMSLETQMKSLVSHWIELSNNIVRHE